MPDDPPGDTIEIHWVYTPTDLFAEKIELCRRDYTFEIEGGRVTAKMSADVYKPGSDFRKALDNELENYFRLWQLHMRKVFEIRRGGFVRIHPDGRRDIVIQVDSIVRAVEVGTPNLISISPDGTVHDTRREQYEAGKMLAEARLDLSSDPDARRMLESYEGSIITPGEELVYLYEIWDALLEKFNGRTVAQTLLNILPVTIDRFRELTCNLPLKQGRHRGRHDVLRDATPAELDDARNIALEMIDKYQDYLINQRRQVAHP